VTEQRRRKTPLSADFALTEERRQYALDHGVPEDEIERQFEQFFKFYFQPQDRMACWESAWHYWALTAAWTYEERWFHCPDGVVRALPL
jgi:hypothetical protein